ncbi:MAG: hypothetical protein ACI4E5_04880 [Suilimivivens sp.]
MKLKYYLRGLGIGIMVTAVILSVAFGSRKETLSDREIMERATELGMVSESGSLAEMEKKENAETPEEPQATPETSPKATPEASPKATPEATPATPDVTEPVQAAKTVVIEVKSGEGSYTVCQKLEKEGLISSASDFDTYLCSNGYDRKLRVGSHEIPADAEPERIARIMCGIN